jgi:hypothetical protein
MDDTLLRIEWMRAILRPTCVTNPSYWPEDDVVKTFAARGNASFEQWLEAMGLGKEMEAIKNEAALDQMKAVGFPVEVKRE